MSSTASLVETELLALERDSGLAFWRVGAV